MSGLHSFGLDLSLTSTGVGRVGPTGRADWWRVRTTPAKHGDDAARRAHIADEIARDIAHAAEACETAPLIVVEAVPTHGAFSIVPLAMLHGVVLDRLATLGFPVHTVPASTLKKWATGKGNKVSKEEMVAVAATFGYGGSNGDEADGLCLAWFGQHLLGNERHLTPQRASCLQSASLVLGTAGGEAA